MPPLSSGGTAGMTSSGLPARRPGVCWPQYLVAGFLGWVVYGRVVGFRVGFLSWVV